ncbi:PML-RARA-regulated adapter molecule 1 isoform X1 [Ixodes scapularis]
MNRPRAADEPTTFYPAVEYGLYRVGPSLHRFMTILEWQTGQKRMTLFIFSLGLLCLFMLLSKNAPFVCSLTFFVIAAHISFRNIEVTTKDEDARSIVFWLIFGLFNLFDYYADLIRAHIPFFWLFKVLFLTWCLLPTPSNGVTVIYFHLLQPLFLGTDVKSQDGSALTVVDGPLGSGQRQSRFEQGHPGVGSPGQQQPQPQGPPGAMNGQRSAPVGIRDMMMRRDALDRGDYDVDAKRARRY